MKATDGSLREWTHAHIATAVLNGGQVALVFVLVLVTQMSGEEGLALSGGLGFLVVVGTLAVAVAVAYLSWRFNEYRLGDDAVYHRKGLVFRQHKQARLDRLQAVDVVQPIVPRIFGFAEVKVEVAGGRGSGIRLQYLRVADAEIVRNEILALAAGYQKGRSAPASAAGGGAVEDVAPEAPVREIFAVPAERLIGSLVLSWPTLIFLGLPMIGILVYLAAGGTPGGLANAAAEAGIVAGGAGAAALGVFASLWPAFNSGFNFTAGIAADGIRLSHGLLDTRRQTVPPGRIQAIRLKQSLLWRRKGWWKITVNVAGYQDDQAAVSTLMPVGTEQEALHALWLVLPDLGDRDPAGTIATAMRGKGSENGFTPSPTRSWVFDVFQFRRRGVRATDRALLIRRGLFVREFFVVPHERTQSLALVQGPLQRALSLATLQVHSTHGPVRPVAQHLALEDAAILIEDQSRRARERRARQTPERWAATVLS